MLTEADTCRKFVVPLLQKAGWDEDPHSIAEQRFFTDGRIVSHGQKATRRPGKRADYLLRYTRDFVLAVVEAKAAFKKPGDGLQQAKDYAATLDLAFAYSTNGTGIVEFDFMTGRESELTEFPTPTALWTRLRAAHQAGDDTVAQRFLTPANLTTGKDPRYYQRIAIERVIWAILRGQRRLLITMATGTGKTVVAFQICWKLWTSRWNRKNEPQRKPRILYLADRNFLVDDPKDKIFAPFGEARHKIEQGMVVFSRELYFATYQSIAKDERRPGLYKEFAPDFFDLIIVDECHRGSAKEDSSWREILEYFEPAYQLGMTATPLRDENRDTYLYFGNPLYTYSLKQGIDEQGKVKAAEVLTPEEPEDSAGKLGDTSDHPLPSDGRGVGGEGQDRRKLYFDGGRVEIAVDLVYELDAAGQQLRVVKLTDYTAEKVRSLCAGPGELRARWLDANQRAGLLQQLAERGIDFEQVAAQTGKPEADPFDLLCYLAFNAPLLTRRQRADRLKKQQAAFFAYFGPEARGILNGLLEKYATDGELQFTLPDVLKVPPISQHGNVAEIMGVFGGADQLRHAVSQLQALLYEG